MTDKLLQDAYRWKKLIDFYPQNKDTYRYIYKSLYGPNDTNSLIPYVGAGLSFFAGYPVWSEALKEMAEGYAVKDEICNIIKDTYDLYAAGELLQKTLGGPLLHRKIQDCFTPEKIKVIPVDELKKQAVWMVPELFKKICLTTNFDKVLERVYKEHPGTKFEFKVVTPTQEYSNTDTNGNRIPCIIKLHGSIDFPFTDIILSRASVDEHYLPNSNLMQRLQRHMNEDSLLFLGASLKNDHIVEVLRAAWGQTRYAILPVANSNEAKDRLGELQGLNIIPLFYPYCPGNQQFPEAHDWVKIILQWLAGKWQPYEEKEKNKIEQMMTEDDYFRYDVYLGSYVFQDSHFRLNMLINFLDDTNFGFAWWTICGNGDGGKTRWSIALKNEALLRNWEVHYFNTEDEYSYEDVFNLPLFMDRHTLLIFDDADFYDVPKDTSNAGGNNKKPQHSFFQRFVDTMKGPISGSNSRHRLRIIFTYTKHISISGEEKTARYWWTKLSDYFNPFSNSNYAEPLELKWTADDVEELIKKYIKEKYRTQPDDLAAGLERIMGEWLQNPANEAYRTPLVGMLCADAFFSDELEESLQSLPARLAQIKNRNPGVGEMENEFNKFIEKIKTYMIDFYKLKTEKMDLKNFSDKSKNQESSGDIQKAADTNINESIRKDKE
jgi:hypothetical protein